MRLHLSYAIVGLFLIALFAGIAPAEADPAPDDADESEAPSTARLIVGHKGALPPGLDHILKEHGAHLVRADTHLDFAVVTVPADLESDLVRSLTHTHGIRYVKTDGIMEAYYQPNDPRYPEQWGPPTIGMHEAWNLGLGDHTIEVGVLDTGIDYTHADLDDNVCRLGPDFHNGDADPMDDHFHGTHVAGTVAAEIGNLQGVAGMGNVCVVPVKVLSGGGWGHWSDLASALTWSADNGIEIISMSLGGCPGCDPGEPVTSAMAYAASKGVLIIAAAGNAYCDGVGYPAAYQEAIAVASTREPGDQISTFSSCGPEVEVAAPGEDIISTMPGDSYDDLSGTSMAAPHVSGAAALFWSRFPHLDADIVRCVIAQNADDITSAGPDDKSGFGRIDVAGMMANPDCVPMPPLAPQIEALPGDAEIHVGWTKPFAWGGVDGYEIHRGTAPDALSLYATIAGGENRTFTDPHVTVGTTYHYAVAGYNGAGSGALSDPIALEARHAVEAPVTYDFESGTQGWTATGLWHWDDVRADSGDLSMWFGRETGGWVPILSPVRHHYDTGRAEYGVLVSPPLKVPQNASSISFWEHLDLEEAPREHGLIEIARANDPFNFTPLWSKGWELPHVGPAAVDLSPYAGETVTVRFVVDTVDTENNRGEGWHVDTIRFEASPPAAYAPSGIIHSPGPFGYSGSTVYTEGVFSDPNGDADVTDITVSLPGIAPVEAQREGHAFFAALPGAPTGEHDLTVRFRDSTGLEHQTQRTIRVDGDLPTAEVENPAGGIHDCRMTLTGIARDTGGSGLHSGYAFVGASSDLETGSHAGEIEFQGGNEERFSTNVTLPGAGPGPFEVHLVIRDQAGNANVTVHGFERSDVDCRPRVELTSPSDGATVGGEVPIEGVVEFYGSGEGWYVLFVDEERVSGGFVGDMAQIAHSWNTYAVADGDHTIEVFVVDEILGLSNWTRLTVNVSNPREPTVVHEAFDGTLGCSVGAWSVRLRDACGDASHRTSELMPGLTTARLVLSWDGDLGDVESLSLNLQVGVRSWEVTAAPGERQLVLLVDEGEVLTHDLRRVRIEVRAAYGEAVPSIVLDEDFHIEADWAYWGAPFPV